MPFRFKKSSCVAVGTFNIYIIQPPWLRKVAILPAELAGVTMEAKLDEPGFRFTPAKLPIQWIVKPDRIEVLTTYPKYDCGSPVAEVLGNCLSRIWKNAPLGK